MPALGAGLLLLVAFLTTGGDLSGPPTQVPTSWVDVVLIVAGGCAAAALVITRRAGSGTLSFSLFAAVAVLAALSIIWSVAPDQSWEESGRTVAYVAVFGVALVTARWAGLDSRAAVIALTTAAMGLCIWALVVKVFNLNLYGQQGYGPVLAPFGYWNTTGVTGALALPGLIWLVCDRDASPLARGLFTAGITIAASVVALSLSRSADAAAVIGTVVPLFLLRARRRAVVTLILGLLAAVPIWLYGLTDHNIYGDTVNSIYGADAGTIHRAGPELVLGLIILGMALIATAAGRALSAYADTAVQPAARVRWFDRGMRAAVAAVPVVIVLWLLVNSRGPFGEISHLWRNLTSVNGPSVGGTSSRLGSISSSRSAYWRQALSVGEHHLLGGTGAGTFMPAHLRYPTATLTPHGQDVSHTHGYVLDVFAAFGLTGIVLNLALLIAWFRDARRAVRGPFVVHVTNGAPFQPGQDTPSAREIDARLALIGVVIAFGVSSALDWTWYFPGVAVPALCAAGWIAGVSGPRRSSAAPLVPAGPDRPAGTPPRTALAARPGAIIALTALAALTLAVAWESLQPMRAVQSANASLNAQFAGNSNAAVADARAAVNEDPYSILAMTRLANVYGAEQEPALKLAELVKATHTQSDNPQPFATLGGYLLCTDHNFAAAVPPLTRATMLDITNTYFQSTLLTNAMAHQTPTAATCDNVA